MMPQTTPGIRMVQTELGALLRCLGEVLDAGGCPYYLAYGTALGAARHEGFIPWDVDADVHVHRADYAKAVKLLIDAGSSEFEVLNPGDAGYEHLFARLAKPGINHMLLRVDLFPLDPAPSGKTRQRLYIKTLKLLAQIFMVRVMDSGERRHYSTRKHRQVRLLKVLLAPARPSWIRGLAELVRALPQPNSEPKVLVNSFGSYGSREFFPAKWFGEPNVVSFEGHPAPMPTETEAYLQQVYGEFRNLPSPESIEKEVLFAEQFYVQPLVRMGLSQTEAL